MKLKLFVIVSGISCFSFSWNSFANCPDPDDIQAWMDSSNGLKGDTANYNGTSWTAFVSGSTFDEHKGKILKFNKQAFIVCSSNSCGAQAPIPLVVPHVEEINCHYYGYNRDDTAMINGSLLLKNRSLSTLKISSNQWQLMPTLKSTPTVKPTYLQCTADTVCGCEFPSINQPILQPTTKQK